MTCATIADHGIIGNMRSAALVNAFGEIDFFCFPDFDSPSLFARLLDAEQGGSFCIHPSRNSTKGTQIYVPDTNVLLTRFVSQHSILEVADFMPVGDQQSHNCIMRRVTAVAGDAEVDLCCRPAFDYARSAHSVQRCDDGVCFVAEQDSLPRMLLKSSKQLHEMNGGAAARFCLAEGEAALFILGAVEDPAFERALSAVSEELENTSNYWRTWANKSTYKGRWREAVVRSALTLKLLTSAEHGSIVAAPTFGLPEAIGGSRNWDYRFTWMRDASFTLYAFSRLGYIEEGRQFQNWLERRLDMQGARGPIQVMYRVDGTADLDELELPHLSGYRNSRPVRIGNGASTQLQLDIYGELLDAAYLSSKYGDGVPYQAWKDINAVLRWLEKHWRDADEGIWEVRGGKREFLHSRLMCWVAFDRAIRLGSKRSLAGPYDWMEQCRDAIVNDIHDNFWNEELGCFVQYKGGTDVDASTLLMPLLRFISPNDPRWLSTLAVIERELVTDTTVLRYSSKNPVDGLAGKEGGFTACAFWLVEAKARSNQVHEARLLFEKLLAQSNNLMLFAEEVDMFGEQAGNFPQALSHLALISAATYLDRCLDSAPPPTWS